MLKGNKFILMMLLLCVFNTHGNSLLSAGTKDSWWPEQKLPAQIVRIRPVNLSERNLVQSLSGLAAKHVNAGTHNELVWTNVSGTAYNYFLSTWLRRTSVVDKGYTDVWGLVEQYKNSGIVKGYVLYKEEDGNYSLNFATLYASIYDALLIEEAMEPTAKSYGLTLKYDARGYSSRASYTQDWFNTIKLLLNNKLIVTIAPDDYKQRDMAIAHGCMVYWGVDDFYKSVLAWMEPNSPVVGWNDGDESAHVEVASKYGMFTSGATIVNMPVLSAGAGLYNTARTKNVNPKLLDFSTGKHYHTFVMSDGDNMMIQATSIPLAPEYWGNEDINNVPVSWTNCPVNLSQIVPDAWNYIAEKSNPVPGSIVEFGGGYQYPDVYAASRGVSATSVHREFAGIINKKMKMTRVKVFGFITRNSLSSDAAKAAYQIYADSIEDLVGIVAVQYVPYNGGGGNVFWVTNQKGIHIPVFTAKYQMWSGLSYNNSGNPAAIASWVNTAASQSQNTIDWTMVHAWSYFKKNINGTISDATSTDEGAVRGVSPTMWSRELLNDNIVPVSIEELLWRLRMKHYPVETSQVILNYIPEKEDSVSYPKSLEINFGNLTTSSTEMMVATGYNSWLSSSGHQWNSQYCYAQNVTSLPYIGKSIRFGASTLSNTGKATTPKLDLKVSAWEEVVLQLTLGCGSTKGGRLEIKVDNTIVDSINATKDGDEGNNGTTFGAKMYDFEYILPQESVTKQSEISLMHFRTVASEFVYLNKFKIFRRSNLMSGTKQSQGSVVVSQMDRNRTVHITGLFVDAMVEVYSTVGQLIQKQTIPKDGVLQIRSHSDKILLLRISTSSSSVTYKLLNIN